MPRKTLLTPCQRAHTLVASMRPRPDAAENASDNAYRLRTNTASMRPRPDAAENAAIVMSDDLLYVLLQ